MVALAHDIFIEIVCQITKQKMQVIDYFYCLALIFTKKQKVVDN
jgi:hypothetical protein